MQGEFRGDVTRDTFDKRKRFARVLMQQGRVLVDADWNEQTSIVLDYLRSLTADLMGHSAGDDVNSFAIGNTTTGWDFEIDAGTYYVDGLRCHLDAKTSYLKQADFPTAAANKAVGDLTAGDYLVYLDVWERHVTSADDGGIREVALGGPDTATRAQVVTQIKVWPEKGQPPLAGGEEIEKTENFLRDELARRAQVKLRAKVGGSAPSTPCVIGPQARYRGTENQLYRVEIHRGGPAWNGIKDANGKPAGNAATAATIKWSRDNASVAFPIRRIKEGRVRLASLGPDERHSLHENDWVEVVDPSAPGVAGSLYRIETIDRDELEVTLKKPRTGSPLTLPDEEAKRLVLRRWDHVGSFEGAILLTEADDDAEESWIELEDGISVQFAPPPTGDPSHIYRPGDYWLIPARVAGGTVLWPTEVDGSGRTVPSFRPAHGVEHHYAPLAVVTFGAGITVAHHVRRVFTKLTT
jgi:Family of unknown function (DUF6519)